LGATAFLRFTFGVPLFLLLSRVKTELTISASGAKHRQENPKNRDDNRDGEDGGQKSAGRPLPIHSSRLWMLPAERYYLTVYRG
jgi:hypothetical protein